MSERLPRPCCCMHAVKEVEVSMSERLPSKQGPAAAVKEVDQWHTTCMRRSIWPFPTATHNVHQKECETHPCDISLCINNYGRRNSAAVTAMTILACRYPPYPGGVMSIQENTDLYRKS